jgi:transcriptional regulator with XRE-family HTH domain
MTQKLNLVAIKIASRKSGFSQSNIAQKLNVTREAVSKWFNGEKFPRPDKLLKLGMYLQLKYDELVMEEPDAEMPRIAFRKRAHTKTQPHDIQRAVHMGILLRKLVPHLKQNRFEQPPVLKEPACNYSYIQQVCCSFREEMKILANKPLPRETLIAKVTALEAIIIPVLWGKKDMHENALHIYLPDSKTTWIYLNLDANSCDFKFWLAHELGHVYAPSLLNDEGEEFADAFAQALLYPECLAKALYSKLRQIGVMSARIDDIKKEADRFEVAPYTVYKALEAYCAHHNLPKINIGKNYYGAFQIHCKNISPVSMQIWKTETPDAGKYIAKCRELFGNTFFDALSEYLQSEKVPGGFIRQVTQMSLLDTMSLKRELV